MGIAGSKHRRAAAFFDVDGTLFNGLTIVDMVHTMLEDTNGQFRDAWLNLERAAPTYDDRARLTGECLQLFAGQSWSNLIERGYAWYTTVGRRRLLAGTVARLEEHRRRGDAVVLVSGSWTPCLDPIAEDLHVDRTFCCEVEVIGDTLTGEVPTILIAEAKARAVRSFAHEAGIDLARSAAYGDDESDEPMLALVGRPVAVRPTPALAEIAHARSWQILDSDAATGSTDVSPAGSPPRSSGRTSPPDRRDPSAATRR